MSDPEFTTDTYCPRCYEPLVKAEPSPDGSGRDYNLAHEPGHCSAKYLRDISATLSNLLVEMRNTANQTAYIQGSINDLKEVIRNK